MNYYLFIFKFKYVVTQLTSFSEQKFSEFPGQTPVLDYILVKQYSSMYLLSKGERTYNSITKGERWSQ